MSTTDFQTTLLGTEALWRSRPHGEAGSQKVLDICQIWGDAVLSTRTFGKGRRVTVGTQGCDFQVGAEAGVHTLVIDHQGVPTVLVPGGSSGFVEQGTQRLSFDEMVAAGLARKSVSGLEIPMVDDRLVALELHGMAFVVRWASAGRKAAIQWVMDYPFAAMMTGFLMLGGLVGTAAYLKPYTPSTSSTEKEDRYFELLMQRPEPEVAKATPRDRAKGPEGAAGSKIEKKEAAKGNTLTKKQRDREVVDEAGLNGAFRDEALAQLGNSGLPGELAGGIPGLIGHRGGKPGEGGLGKGQRGPGFGGGGEAEASDELGLHGGDPTGGGTWTQKERGPKARLDGHVVLVGGLDRSLIDEVIKRNMSAIRYCYQRELTKDNSLGGKIVIKFTIAGDGAVSTASVKSSSMGHAGVEDCLVKRFYKMEFPKPKGGGSVLVSYPFLFTPG